LSSDDLRQFPCEPLKKIDRLWVKHSGGRFGFSVQKEMYLECGGVADGRYHKEAWQKLIKMNGWASGIKFDITSPNGHLPVEAFDWDGDGRGVGKNEWGLESRRRCLLLSHPDL